MNVPFFRPEIDDGDIAAVLDVLRSGWLTTGLRVKEFEAAFARYVGAPHAVAVSSCTAALHLALAALGLRRGQGVVVPTLTFAATAEVVTYCDATPVFVDVEPETLCMDPAALEGTLAGKSGRATEIVGGIPVHYGGQMAAMPRLARALRAAGCFVVEDAAHALPAAVHDAGTDRWVRVGELADVACFSFYANKTITTGEGGMATTADPALERTIRSLSLHGMSRDAWARFRAGGSWDYAITAAGFKYNMTDLAAALGLRQLARADRFRSRRATIASRYSAALADLEEVEVPRERADRRHAWHLYPLRLRLDRLSTGRDEFIRTLAARGVGTSVHWRPLHMQPFYAERYGYRAEEFPVAFREWQRLVSLPIFPGLSDADIDHVVTTVRDAVAEGRKRRVAVA
jgi:dTDP-4-amino-4,6-dideoxygalactose transaminase